MCHPATPMHVLEGLDVSLYRALNGLCGMRDTLDRVVYSDARREIDFMNID
jgi:hypothetical protein